MSLLRFFKILGAPNSTTAIVNQSNSEVQLALLNTNRKSIKIVNDSNNKLYIKFSSPITLLSYTYVLNKKDTLIEDEYIGPIYGIWDTTAGGNAIITETEY